MASLLQTTLASCFRKAGCFSAEQASRLEERVSEVIDCWFDSGCMPFAQWGFPHQGVEEFKAACPKIESWGVPVADAEAQFKAIDTNDGGIILFKEFADWALKQKLDADGDADDSDLDTSA